MGSRLGRLCPREAALNIVSRGYGTKGISPRLLQVEEEVSYGMAALIARVPRSAASRTLFASGHLSASALTTSYVFSNQSQSASASSRSIERRHGGPCCAASRRTCQALSVIDV